jgi:hypothetical protein
MDAGRAQEMVFPVPANSADMELPCKARQATLNWSRNQIPVSAMAVALPFSPALSPPAVEDDGAVIATMACWVN